MRLQDAFFGIKRWDFSQKRFEDRNLYASIRVLDSIAMWKCHKHAKELYKEVDDAIFFCFGDTRHRVEWEMFVGPIFENQEPIKTDVYTLYVEPNKELLYEQLQKISVQSCREWLKERKCDYEK